MERCAVGSSGCASAEDTMILAGDLGGTKCNLALFSRSGKSLKLLASHRYPTREYAHLPFESLLKLFLQYVAEQNGALGKEKIRVAGFGGAGAVVHGTLHGTYVPWALEARKLAAHLHVREVLLINDVEAAAFSVPFLSSQDFLNLNQGSAEPHKTQALISAGTGLGEAILFWDGRHYRAIPTEGGEADFAPRTEREIELLRHLKTRLPRVCAEEILSGGGFRLIHEFLDARVRHGAFEQNGSDAAKQITQQALAGACDVCVQTLDMWTQAYASEAGNLALRTLALGGVYVAGGIATKILPKLRDGSFARSFADKGRFAQVLSRVPLHVVLNEDAPLWGAARFAAQAAGAKH